MIFDYGVQKFNVLAEGYSRVMENSFMKQGPEMEHLRLSCMACYRGTGFLPLLEVGDPSVQLIL